MIISTIVVNGLIVGVYYAMMALGLTMIFGVLRIVNFAHGEFYMLGGFAYVLLYHSLGVPVLLALPAAILAGVALGWIVEKLLIRPVLPTSAAGVMDVTNTPSSSRSVSGFS